jgi:hypothetical protein
MIHPLRRVAEPACQEESSEEKAETLNPKNQETPQIGRQKAMAGPGSPDYAPTIPLSSWIGRSTVESKPDRCPRRSSCSGFERTA